MKRDNTLEVSYKERAAFYVSEHPPDEVPGPESGPHELPPDTTQAGVYNVTFVASYDTADHQPPGSLPGFRI